MSKKFLQQPNIIPYSISAISNNPDISSSSFTGIFQQRKPKDETSEYKIKVKKPYDLNNKSSNQINLQGKITTEKSVNYDFQLNEQNQDQPNIQPEQIPLTENLTGYEICKTSFSQEQIIQAFKVIDINKDQNITEEDIIFFLEYIKEPYTKEEVKEMIEMVSSDKKKVTLQDFKKIGKGSIIPFADIRIPDEKTKQKKVIYENIKNIPSLYQQNPSILLNASKNEIISHKKFQESKNISKNTQFQSIKIINDEEQLQFLVENIRILTQEDFEKRKDKFISIEMINATQVIKNYNQFCGRFIQEDNNQLNFKEIAKILQINEKQAKVLYNDETVLAKRVVLEAIAFSPLNKMKKFQLGMTIMLKKKTINFSELYFLFQILKGKDEKGSLKKKLLTVLKSKNIQRQEEMDKFYALQLLNTYNYNFNF